jgi:V/A-type H+-transporting ATPase subunit K
MSEEVMRALCLAGGYAAVCFAAVGSGLGAGVAGMAAIGAWKKCYAQNKQAPFLLLAFAGAPLSQTIYGMIMLIFILGKLKTHTSHWPLFLIMGVFGGVAIGVSAWYQGKAAASACDAFSETGKGFANNLMILGIIETVAIFTLVFSLLAMPK